MALRWKRLWIQANVLKQQRGFFYSTQYSRPFTDGLSVFFLWPLANPQGRVFTSSIWSSHQMLRFHCGWGLREFFTFISAFYPLMSFLSLLCKVNGYLCLCPPEYNGVHCDVKSSGCIGNKCASGSTCVNTPSGHDCVCPIGYEGTFCETKSNVRWWPFLSTLTCLLKCSC